MRTPNERAGFPPEADLRTVMVRRLDRRSPAGDAERAPAPAELPDGLFFTKGFASTDGFRPSYWSYCKAPDTHDPAAIQPAPADEARSSGAAKGRAPQTVPPHDDELAKLEQAFLEVYRQALMQEPEASPGGHATAQSEAPSEASGNSDLSAPSADLRTIQLRPGKRDTARVDELFVRKSRAGAKEILSPGPEQIVAVTGPTVLGMQEPRALPANSDAAHTVIASSVEIAMPIAEPVPVAEERAGATEAPSASPEATPVAAEPERPDDAAALRPNATRGSLLAPIQEAIIVFGCVSLLISLRVFNPSDVPPPRPVVALEQPDAVAPEANPLSAALTNLLARGDERLGSGDVAGARLFYKKAYDAGSARGALMMGATYDAKFLAGIGVYGLHGDERSAMAWYRRAGDLGDHEAAKLGNTEHK